MNRKKSWIIFAVLAALTATLCIWGIVLEDVSRRYEYITYGVATLSVAFLYRGSRPSSKWGQGLLLAGLGSALTVGIFFLNNYFDYLGKNHWFFEITYSQQLHEYIHTASYQDMFRYVCLFCLFLFLCLVFTAIDIKRIESLYLKHLTETTNTARLYLTGYPSEKQRKRLIKSLLPPCVKQMRLTGTELFTATGRDYCAEVKERVDSGRAEVLIIDLNDIDSFVIKTTSEEDVIAIIREISQYITVVIEGTNLKSRFPTLCKAVESAISVVFVESGVQETSNQDFQ